MSYFLTALKARTENSSAYINQAEKSGGGFVKQSNSVTGPGTAYFLRAERLFPRELSRFLPVSMAI